MMNRMQEIKEELTAVTRGRGAKVLDALLPVVVYVSLYASLGFDAAWQGALGVAVVIGLFRFIRGQALVYVFGGLAGVGLSVLLALRSGGGEGFFFPGLLSGLLTVAACFISLLFNRPLVAWTSWAFRRWPLDWYWHPQVLPAYRDVTFLWGLVYGLRLALDAWLYVRGDLVLLGTVRLLMGWPLILALLVFSYLYGLNRLQALGGPSVAEFEGGSPPPWEGQRRGF